MDFKQIHQLIQSADSKILLVVMDGLGGLPKGLGYGTTLEEASTPNLNDLATQSICGLHQPAGPGITPGSGPAHLALFGYDPFNYQVGRGVLAALGIDFELKDEDVAVRGNFCTIDENGQVIDRRAGRIETAKNRKLCKELRDIDLPGVEVFIELDTLEKNWNNFDFFFVHVKKMDSAGEDGDFDHKVELIEEVDQKIPRVLDLGPDVIVITGDHSTPAGLKSHSWHPVSVLLHSRYCRPDGVVRFGERDCIRGGLGPRFPATDLMPLALANALRLKKFGA